MAQTTMQSSHLSSNLLEHAALLIKMSNASLNLNWVHEFDNQQITDCCSRMETFLNGISVFEKNLQRALIQNPLFAEYYAKLLPMFPEDPPPEPMPAPAPVYNRKHRPVYYTSPPRYTPSSRCAVLKTRLSDLLALSWTQEVDLTAYPQQQLLELLEIDRLNDWTRLVYLENFITENLSEAGKQVIANSLSACYKLPLHLDDYQKSLLNKPYVVTQHLFAEADFAAACELFESCPKLVEIMELLHTHEVCEELSLADYSTFSLAVEERSVLMTSIISCLGADSFAGFLTYWQKSEYSMEELRRAEARITAQPKQNWDKVFANYSGYVNLLYGNRYKTIELSSVASYQVDILVYAIIHDKKHFIKLVDEHAALFLDLPQGSILLQRDVYEKHLNINELTAKNLEDCRWMRLSNFDPDQLLPNRSYTFQELTVLYDSPSIYITLYNLLDSKSQDYRLRVFRQLRKRDVLKSFAAEDLGRLAGKLNIKPLYDWKEQEFGHISGLTAEDAASLLVHFEEVRHLLPSIYHRTDVVLALKNKDFLAQVNCMEELKSHIIQIDAEWRALTEAMALSEEFMTQYRDNILQFLCSNGAYIVRTYEGCLGPELRAAFYRVVKAELMGQLDVLKYFEGDLQQELDMSLTVRIKDGWKRNLFISEGGMEARENDDFFSTMLLGMQPKRTCLAYTDGVYRECLLSAFDSNKKVLYVSMNGKIVGRAFLRLTKGRLANAARGSSRKLSFVDVENIADASQEEQLPPEYPTLFLERPYVSNVSGERMAAVKDMLLKLACTKAKELGTMLILSLDYSPRMEGFARTRFDVFISKSKAGAQYLDSLDGEATTSVEGSYKTNSFLVKSDFLINEYL